MVWFMLLAASLLDRNKMTQEVQIQSIFQSFSFSCSLKSLLIVHTCKLDCSVCSFQVTFRIYLSHCLYIKFYNNNIRRHGELLKRENVFLIISLPNFPFWKQICWKNMFSIENWTVVLETPSFLMKHSILLSE